MSADRLSRPYRADFARGPVAEREHEVQCRCARCREFGPILRSEMIDAVIATLQDLERMGVDGAGRKAPGTEAAESRSPDPLHQALGHDAAGGVSGAEEQHVATLLLRGIVVGHPVVPRNGRSAEVTVHR